MRARPALLLLAAAAANSKGSLSAPAADVPNAFCRSRSEGCSGHGKCVLNSLSWSCDCDDSYEGERCDVWRGAAHPELLLRRLDDVRVWENCTHGRADNRSALVQYCDHQNHSLCEGAGAPTVPQTCPNQDMFLICDYTGCYPKPFCEGFTPPGTTPPGRNPQPYHCFCPNGASQQQTTSRPITVPGIPGTICAPPCESNGQCCESYQRDHRFHTPLPILAKPQCVLTDANVSHSSAPDGKCKGSMCVLTCDPSIPQIGNCSGGMDPDGRPNNSSCPTNCQFDQHCYPVPDASFSPKGICVWTEGIHDDWRNASTGKRFPNHPRPDSLPVNGWSTGRLLCGASSSASNESCFTCPAPPPPSPPPAPQVKFMCDTVGHNCFPTPAGNWSNESSCTAACAKPTPPPPPPPTPPPPPPQPPPPLGSSPCIRFIHALPVNYHVDVVITQDQSQQQRQKQQQEEEEEGDTSGLISYSWNNYAFANYSNWVNVFKSGSGTLTLFENVGGQRGARTLYSKEIPLTPGPLVVAVKVALNQDPSDPSKYWPPSEPDQIETIAASYPPATGLASVRLFNLSPDTKTAGMTSDGAGAATISSVPYSLGSKWESFALGQQIFRIVDDFASPAVPVRRPSKPTPCSAWRTSDNQTNNSRLRVAGGERGGGARGSADWFNDVSSWPSKAAGSSGPPSLVAERCAGRRSVQTRGVVALGITCRSTRPTQPGGQQ